VVVVVVVELVVESPAVVLVVVVPVVLVVVVVVVVVVVFTPENPLFESLHSVSNAEKRVGSHPCTSQMSHCAVSSFGHPEASSKLIKRMPSFAAPLLCASSRS
jgi:hypothetical protein